MRFLRGSGRSAWTSVRLLALFTVVLGVLYPLAMTGIGQLAFPEKANGSLVRDANGHVRGSSLIGQSFSDSDGAPLRQYFQPRPSVNDYDAEDSGGSNLGPQSPQLIAEIESRRSRIAQFNGVPESEVPPDAVTASGSGLDPDISVPYARIQIDRVANARGLDRDAVQTLVERHTRSPAPGLGPAAVNVVELNLALDQL